MTRASGNASWFRDCTGREIAGFFDSNEPLVNPDFKRFVISRIVKTR